MPRGKCQLSFTMWELRDDHNSLGSVCSMGKEEEGCPSLPENRANVCSMMPFKKPDD